MQYKLYQVDAFTTQKFRGNPAGVVLNADGLSEAQMQDIAREMNCSETAFVLSPSAADHELWLRYFTPTKEVPICGHATIAANYVRAKVLNVQHQTRVLVKTGVGILPIEIVPHAQSYQILMTQTNIQAGALLSTALQEKLLGALGLNMQDLDVRCPIQVYSTGSAKVMIGIQKRATLNALKPDLTTLAALSKSVGADGYFVFTFDVDEPDILACARMFAPAAGIPEDPVTGNANVPFGAYLVQHRLVKHSETELRFTVKQGEAMQRPGMIAVTVSIQNNLAVQVKITGYAVIVFETTLTF